MVHILNNVQSGLCPEDCGYCSQSRDSNAAIRKYPLKSDDEILAEAERAALAGASRYCLVLSGRGPSLERTRRLADIVRRVKERFPIEVCLSVGIIEEEHARVLAARPTTPRSAAPTTTRTGCGRSSRRRNAASSPAVA
jgi:biotin synthase